MEIPTPYTTNTEKILLEQIETTKSIACVAHKCLVIIDDWLCAQYGLSRRARGKYVLREVVK